MYPAGGINTQHQHKRTQLHATKSLLEIANKN